MNPALYPLIATVTGAFIAGFVAFLTSMLSKELKTSEFRYSWLNAVLDDTATFIGAAQSALMAPKSRVTEDAKEASVDPELAEAMAAYYRARIRLYPQKHSSAIAALDSLHTLLIQRPTPDAGVIDPKLREVVQTTHEALKDEWEKVKRGELVFRLTKYVSLIVITAALLLPFGFYFWAH